MSPTTGFYAIGNVINVEYSLTEIGQKLFPIFKDLNGWAIEYLENLATLTLPHGILYYDPWAGPFGGSECLVALIESFGNMVTYDSWHSGPHRRFTVGWDYELAKTLVSKGKGFTHR